MANINRVLVDMDGVLVDFLPSALELLGFTVDDWSYGTWDAIGGLDITPHEFFRSMDRKFWSELPKTSFCDDLMEAVDHFFPDADIYIATAPQAIGETTLDCIGDCLVGKMAWIRRNFWDLAKHDKFILTRHKYLMANENTLLIDDAAHNTDKFFENGGRTLMIPSIGNELHEMTTALRERPKVWLREAFSRFVD